MTIQDLGSIGEFVAAIVVVITLIFLTVQTRQNTQAVKNSTALSGLQFWTDFAARIAHDPEMTDLYVRGMLSFTTLTPDDKVRFDLLAVTFTKAAETFFRLNRGGSLDPSEWESWERSISLSSMSQSARGGWCCPA